MRVIKATLLAPFWVLGLISGYLVRPFFEGAVYGFYSREFHEQARKKKIFERYSEKSMAKEEELLKEIYTGENLQEQLDEVIEELNQYHKELNPKPPKENIKEEG